MLESALASRPPLPRKKGPWQVYLKGMHCLCCWGLVAGWSARHNNWHQGCSDEIKSCVHRSKFRRSAGKRKDAGLTPRIFLFKNSMCVCVWVSLSLEYFQIVLKKEVIDNDRKHHCACHWHSNTLSLMHVCLHDTGASGSIHRKRWHRAGHRLWVVLADSSGLPCALHVSSSVDVTHSMKEVYQSQCMQ